jgi:hypothetical protein
MTGMLSIKPFRELQNDASCAACMRRRRLQENACGVENLINLTYVNIPENWQTQTRGMGPYYCG